MRKHGYGYTFLLAAVILGSQNFAQSDAGACRVTKGSTPIKIEPPAALRLGCKADLGLTSANDCLWTQQHRRLIRDAGFGSPDGAIGFGD